MNMKEKEFSKKDVMIIVIITSIISSITSYLTGVYIDKEEE